MPYREDRDDVVNYGRQNNIILPDVNSTKAKLGDTTPSVIQMEFLVFVNTAPVTVTDLLGGNQGVHLRILGDGQTTLKNNSRINTNTGADKLLANKKVYTFSMWDNVWYESV